MYEYAFMGFLTYTQACNTGNIWSKALAIKQVNQDKNAGGKKGPYKAGLERQKQILEAARQLLVEEGGHNFSIRKVAKLVGISPGNLQHHFATRDELLSAMMDHVISEYLLSLEEMKICSDSPKAYLLSVIEFVTRDLCTKETTVFFPELWSLSNHDENIDALMQNMYVDYRMIYQNTALQINPSLTTEQCQNIGLFISSMIEGFTVFIGYKKPLTEKCDAMVKMIYNASIHAIESGEVPA